MSVLWAFVVLVSIHIGGVDGISDLQLNLPNTPLSATHFQPPNLPVPVSLPKVPLFNEKKSKKDTPVTSEPHCVASVWSFTSGARINEYLNSSVTEAVKELAKCSDMSLGGLLMPILSIMDTKSILGKDGLPGMDSSLPVPNSLLDLLKLQCLSSPSTDNSPLQSLSLNGLTGAGSGSLRKESGQIASNGELSNIVSGSGFPLQGTENSLLSPLSGNKNAKESKESDKSEDPASIKKPASSVGSAISGKGMDGIKGVVEDLKFHATNIVIKNMTTKMEGKSIVVTVDVSTDIGGPPTMTDLAVQIMGFQMDCKIKIKLSVAANDSICTKFISEEKSMQVEKVNVKLLNVIKKQIQCINFPLTSVVSGLMTLKMDFSKEECPIDFPSPWCISATVPDKQDLFKYILKNYSVNHRGLVCAYCAEINYKDKSVPVAGGQSPKLPADTDVALEWHHHLVKAAITHTMNKVSVKTNDTVLQIITVKYKLSDPKWELGFHTDVMQNGVDTGDIKCKLQFSHHCVIDRHNHLSGSMSLTSSECKLEPETDTTKELAKQLVMKVVTLMNDHLSHFNMPQSLMSNCLKGSPVHADAQGNLIASQ